MKIQFNLDTFFIIISIQFSKQLRLGLLTENKHENSSVYGKHFLMNSSNSYNLKDCVVIFLKLTKIIMYNLIKMIVFYKKFRIPLKITNIFRKLPVNLHHLKN